MEDECLHDEGPFSTWPVGDEVYGAVAYDPPYLCEGGQGAEVPTVADDPPGSSCDG